MDTFKKAVVFGAGNIGRGFIGQQFSEAGYEVTFIDIDDSIVNALNKDNRYLLKIVSLKENKDLWVENVKAISAKNIELVSDTIAKADIMATAVGVNVLKHISKPIADGIEKRYYLSKKPLDIILCENLINADTYLRKLVSNHLNSKLVDYLNSSIGFVGASIGRMVPVMTKERKKNNPLTIYVEPYCKLPVDKEAFKSTIPNLVNLIPFKPFSFYIKKKLFIHNMGHAITGYLGNLFGYNLISEAISNSQIKLIVLKAMQESALALSSMYNEDINSLLAHVDDLIYRFANPYLLDTIKRVAKDPIRKISPNDRLSGAIKCCLSMNINPVYISVGLSSALLYEDSEDKNLSDLKNYIDGNGVLNALKKYSDLETDSLVAMNIEYFYNALKSGLAIEEILMEMEYRKVS